MNKSTRDSRQAGLHQTESAEKKFARWWRELDNPWVPDPSKLDWDRVPLDLLKEDGHYRREVLEMFANGLLYQDSKERPFTEGPMVLNPEMYRHRIKSEVYSKHTIDPAYYQGIYKRTHPQGRPWRTKEERANGQTFYK